MARDRRPTTHFVRGELQRRALASPLRIEIVGYFENGRELSVKELAARLGRPAASLYFHVHKLLRAGLLFESGVRGRGPAAESAYRAVADRIAMPVSGNSRAARQAITAVVRALLRQVGREFEIACRSATLLATIPDREAAGRRQRAWLSSADAADARRRLDAVERFLARKSRRNGGVEHTWTSLLIPVAAPPPTARRRAGGRKPARRSESSREKRR